METLCLWGCMLLILVQCPMGFCLLSSNSSMNHLCHDDESNLLLQLKQQLPNGAYDYPDYYDKTRYWNGSTDCCLWDGVTCDDFTGHVIALDLSSSDLTRKLNSNSSLFHLTHLRILNLAYNNFRGSTLPSEFGRLSALTHLNLSFTEFGGEIPMEFYHLSNLVSLDLSPDDSFSFNPDIIRCDVKMLLGNMTRLRVLLLAYQNLSGSELPVNMSSFLTHLDLAHARLRGNLPATIFEKPNLKYLNLGGNYGLEGSLPKSLNRSNVRSINRLDLSETDISGRLPDSIGLMANLNYMDLSFCRFSGPIPDSIGNVTTITSMDLSFNEFSGRLPSTISNLRRLTLLDLTNNHLEGQLPDAFCDLQNLPSLDFSYNYLEGRNPSSLTNMSQLSSIDISSNALTGPFPSRAGLGLQHLREIKFSNNSIQGMIPPWMLCLPSLKELDLSSNKLSGQIGKLNSNTLTFLNLSSNRLNIELQSFNNLTSIVYLDISYNTVTEHGGDIVNVTFPNLNTLDMSSCEIKEFPNFSQSKMPNLHILDLSNNKLHGQIPTWFTSDPSVLSYLDLSANFLTYAGYLPWQQLWYLDLHSNSLRGIFPTSICNISGLFILNLSYNELSGNIPKCLGKLSDLVVLDLRRNEFHGKIPTTLGAMHILTNLGLNGNHLEGPLPPSLAKCIELEVIDLGNNMIHYTFPWWLHTLPKLKILILRSNSFHGSITSPAFTNNSFTNLQIFDLSNNNFTGLLPEKLFATLKAIKYHNQASSDDGLYMRASAGTSTSTGFDSGSHSFDNYEYSVGLSVKGKHVELTKVLKIFTTIDLSSNNFIGGIPSSLSSLTSLRLLNLSHNNIRGSIPQALGRMTNLEQLDLSRNQLTGGIPQTLTSLTFLEALDLSHNHLVGPIPVANQFLTFSNESYAGNPGLCGAPLTRSCGNEGEPPSVGEFEEEADGIMMGFTWKTVVMGYGCGIVLGFILGSVMLSMERPKWLARFVYVESAIILSKWNKRRRVVQRRR